MISLNINCLDFINYMKIKCPEYEWYNSCYFHLLFQEWAKRVKWLDGLTGAWDSGEKHNKRTKSPRKRESSKLSETSIQERNSRGLRCQFTSTPSPIIRPTTAKRSHHRGKPSSPKTGQTSRTPIWTQVSKKLSIRNVPTDQDTYHKWTSHY